MRISNKQIKINYFRMKEVFERVNRLLDEGYLIFDAENELLDCRWRFQFEEPEWDNLKDHCWRSEICIQISPTATQGYFDPDVSWRTTKAELRKWVAVHPRDRIFIITTTTNVL